MVRQRPKGGTGKDTTAQRRALFVEAYLANGGNGTQAAIAAGYSPNGAGVVAARLLKVTSVKASLEEGQKRALDKAKLTADEVVASLARTLRFDPRKLYNEDGSLKAVHELDDDTADALAGVDVVEMAGEKGSIPIYTKKVKWLDKNSAREQGMKHFGLYKADNEQKPAVGSVSIEIVGVPGKR